MEWSIITDSSSDIREEDFRKDAEDIAYYAAPFILTVGGKDFVDTEDLSVSDMLDAMDAEKKASSSSCPSPESFRELLEKSSKSIIITISKELSGSYNSACVARDMLIENFKDKKVAVINSLSAGPGLAMIVKDAVRNIKSGMNFDEVAEAARGIAESSRTIFALCSYDNLVKNGRMKPLVGFVAKKLGFWGIGVASPQGTIEIQGKVRGAGKAVQSILKDMSDWGKPIKRAIISHCQNLEMAETLKQAMQEHFQGISVEIHATRGLCSYYAERNGIILTYK